MAIRKKAKKVANRLIQTLAVLLVAIIVFVFVGFVMQRYGKPFQALNVAFFVFIISVGCAYVREKFLE